MSACPDCKRDNCPVERPWDSLPANVQADTLAAQLNCAQFQLAAARERLAMATRFHVGTVPRTELAFEGYFKQGGLRVTIEQDSQSARWLIWHREQFSDAGHSSEYPGFPTADAAFTALTALVPPAGGA